VARYLGLDLGGTNIKAVILDDSGPVPRVIESSSRPTMADGGPDVVVERIVGAGRAMLDEFGPVRGAGLGVPGLFDRAAGTAVLFPNLPGPWPGHSLRDPVARGLELPTTLINDARSFTLAEGTVGAGRGSRTLVCVTLGTGVGGGIMIDGELHLGAWGVAGEIGHQTVVPNGPLCGCGNRGCAEALTKADVLARLAGRPTAEDVYSGASAGDERCRSAVATVAGYLGIAMANTVTVLGPDRIVVGGGIVAAGEQVLGPIRQAVRNRVTLVPTDEVQVVAAALGSGAGAIGAALAASKLQVPTRSR
jgi:glucokinase